MPRPILAATGAAAVACAAVAVVAVALASAQTAPATPELPGKADIARVAAGRYSVDGDHTQVAFIANHFGFTDYRGLFGGSRGTLTLDPTQPSAATFTVEIPLKQVVTTSDKLTAHLQAAEFFDSAKFPTATFKSTKIEVDGDRATIVGDLTLKGVTRPVALEARFTGAGVNPMNKKATIGFEATTSIRRSEFGVSAFVPMIGDKVDLAIAAAFEKQD